jgi:hypothetical protein
MLKAGSDCVGGVFMRADRDTLTHHRDVPESAPHAPKQPDADTATPVGPAALRPSAYVLSSLLAVGLLASLRRCGSGRSCSTARLRWTARHAGPRSWCS